MSAQSTKEVKLQPKYRSLAFGQKIVPELKISGVWLEEQGFYAGQLVEPGKMALLEVKRTSENDLPLLEYFDDMIVIFEEGQIELKIFVDDEMKYCTLPR